MSSQIISLSPPASALIQSLRSIGYDLKSAVADIIDNSIAADSSNIQINLFLDDAEKVVVVIGDDGNGMTPIELKQAMTLGSHNPLTIRKIDDLGRFGMGLKTASFSQCKTLTVITKKDEELIGASWDLEHVTKANAWELFWLSKEQINQVVKKKKIEFQNNGTYIIWENCDNIDQDEAGVDYLQSLIGEESKKLYEHLSLVFHKFIDKPFAPINFVLNGRSVIAKDPFVVQKKHNDIASSLTYQNDYPLNNELISVKGYLLPHQTKLNKIQLNATCPDGDFFNGQGFYIYRANRLIVWGDWFRILPKTQQNKLARIEVNIPNTLDSIWRLDIKKAKVELPKDLRVMLKQSIQKIGKKSNRVYDKRPSIKRPNSQSLWERTINQIDRKIEYRVDKKNPLFIQLLDNFDDHQISQIKQLIKLIEIMLPVQMMSNDIASSFNLEPTLDENMKQEVLEIITSLKALGMSADEIVNYVSNSDSSSPEVNKFIIQQLEV
jgi:hypothetical protein